MSDDLTVVVDAHARGADPVAALRAAAVATVDLDRDVVAVGDAAWIAQQLRSIPHDAERLRVVDAGVRFVADAPQPARDAIGEACVRVSVDLLARDPRATLVTGARIRDVVRVARESLQPLAPDVRPAMASVFPTLLHRGETRDPFALVLDVGAAIDCDADDLCVFAVLGATYARLVSQNPRPRVGLLCPAGALTLAPERVSVAHRRLLATPDVELDYVGPLRADQLTRGDVDVVVTDGFAGDVFVRSLEGIAGTADRLLEIARERFRWRLGVSMLAQGVSRLRELGDWENYGGAPLLGLDRGVIVAQRESGTRTYANAIRLAAKIDRLGVIPHTEQALQRLASERP